MMDAISLEGLDKAAVLAALYNASKPQGMGFLHYDPTPMTAEEAGELLADHTNFGYLKGRVMKVDLSTDELNPWGYDRDNGQGAALRAIEAMQSGDVDAIHETHLAGTSEAANDARKGMRQESEVVDGVIILGMADVTDVLGPAIDDATQT